MSTATDSSGPEKFGPSPYFVFSLIAGNGYFWTFFVVAALTTAPVFVELRTLPPLFLRCLGLAAHYHVGTIAMALATLLIFRAVLCFITTVYRADGNALIITHGIFSPFSRCGLMRSDTNTIAYALVLDTDISKNPIQMITNVGALVIRTIEGETIHIPSVPRPERIRQFITDRSGTRNIRGIVHPSGHQA